MRRHAEGADLSKLVRLPRWIDALLSHDRVAYPLHAIAGDLLNRLDAPPSMVGLEWLKAAAHAGSERAIQRVADGVIAARRRASSAEFDLQIGAAIVRRVTCGGDDVLMQRRQLAVLARAGIPTPAPESLLGRPDRVSER
jgi:hypothetical protein